MGLLVVYYGRDLFANRKTLRFAVGRKIFESSLRKYSKGVHLRDNEHNDDRLRQHVGARRYQSTALAGATTTACRYGGWGECLALAW